MRRYIQMTGRLWSENEEQSMREISGLQCQIETTIVILEP